MSTYSSVDLVTDFESIDSSYSVVAEAITLDLPDTLGETKLEYTALTATEILEKAAKYFEADYIDKQFDINSDAESDIAKLDAKISAVEDALITKISDITAECIEKCLASQYKSIQNGIARSSVYTDSVTALETEYDEQKEDAEADSTSTIEGYQSDIAVVEQYQQDALDNLDAVRDAEIEEKKLDIEEDELDRYNDVTDYNNDVDVREVEYQYDKAIDLYDAQNDERDRAISIAELQLKLGDAGLADFIAQQKFAYAKSVVKDMTYTEAKYFLTSGISSHLGDYYASFVDYVNNLS